MEAEAAKISLRQQLTICAVFCALAVVIILFSHPKPYASTLFHGLPPIYQILIGLAFGAIYWLASLLGSKFIAKRKAAQHIAESYNRLNLTGWNPIWIAVAAGLGEELLFRGALQPLLGILLTSVLLILVHIHAYRFIRLNKRVLLQSVSIFSVSVAFGFVAIYVGVITAMILHATMDAVALSPGGHPRPDGLSWLAWKESAQTLLEKLLVSDTNNERAEFNA